MKGEAEGPLEERMAHLEGILSQMNERLASFERHLNERFASLEKMLLDHLAASDKRMDRLEAGIEANFRWPPRILLPMWITTILAILSK